MTAARILAPAKVNLGLAVLGKRDDGYHDVDTVMAMIDVCDVITVTQGVVSGISISGMDDVPVESNLMTKAIQLWCDEAYVQPNFHIDIEKHIPSPAGIGGGSSDGAAVLRALNAMHDAILPDDVLHSVAAEIGADCPFFLGAACSRATGTGTDLAPLRSPEGHLVLAIPDTTMVGKTGSLYGALIAEDYGDSGRIEAIVNAIQTGNDISGEIPNSFWQPASRAFPILQGLKDSLREVAGSASLSGAGPAMFAITESEQVATTWAEHLETLVAEDVKVLTARFLQEPPEVEILP